MLLAIAYLILGSFALKDGDRVVFYGDSITEQQHYTSLVETFVRTRYPKLNVRFHARGWGGDCTWGGGGGSSDQRMKRDVRPLDPTVLTIMLGMNDAGYVPYSQKIYDTYDEWYGKLLAFVHQDAPHARLTLIRTSPWDAVTRDLPESYPEGKWQPWRGYNDVLQRFGTVVEKRAAAEKAMYVDFNQPLLDVLRRARTDREHAQQIIPDGIHPSVAGAVVMACELLKAWGISPTIAMVELDASAKRVIRSENAQVSGFDGLRWEQIDGSLPFCVDPDVPEVQLVLRNYDLASVNRQLLKVVGLAGGPYQLLMDDKPVADVSAADLAAGLDLTRYDTPMRRQALKVLQLVRERCELDFIKWRKVEVEHGDLRTAGQAGRALRRMDDEMCQRIRRAATPIAHRCVLRLLR